MTNQHAILGDVRAEYDHQFLDKAFYKTGEYRSLIESSGRHIVVGRRGTGKSATFYKLVTDYAGDSHTATILVQPTDTDMIGFRYFVKLFGTRPSHLRAAANHAWRYALICELLLRLSSHYKVRECEQAAVIASHAERWRRLGKSLLVRLQNCLEPLVDTTTPEEKRVTKLGQTLDTEELLSLATIAVQCSKTKVIFLADKLDEGYEPDEYGTCAINGLLYALGTITSAIPDSKAVAFIRDNILRSIQRIDPDYSRNTESDCIRLHWDEYNLFNMVCDRIRAAYHLKEEQNLKVWNHIANHGIDGKEGFRACLRLTLYRPRDLIHLLNNAIYSAKVHDRTEIVSDDVVLSAKEISTSRLDDLKKEYSEVFPGLDKVIRGFENGSSEVNSESLDRIRNVLLAQGGLSVLEEQTLAILRNSQDVAQVLHSVGFLGVWQGTSSSFVFCHDGKDAGFDSKIVNRYLIHPCYWIALGIDVKQIDQDAVEEIHDDYDVEVRSETPELRKHRIGQIMSRGKLIPKGIEGASDFEAWCHEALSVIFAGNLANIELHPNKAATQRRDIVARNRAQSDAWSRIYSDYGVRQVVFEVKNFDSDLGPDEYRQMLSYLCGEYGRLGFIINRSLKTEIERDKELKWAREIYYTQNCKVLIIKLTAELLCTWLSKLRSPQKHDAPDKALSGLLDRYVRTYLALS